ncbi:TetR family transcriptional regulator [Flavobacterium cyanobacteriorum]|uniref:TetR family transcriptional regulator n=1 Tax=Flavobacterium cyanobacteriorum TaxID=2022802 RepID=A0A255YZV4_9FLAO|nr:TetR/AcrR family transcriptional regulator [Flavobacterium cyanobacteriorum]OYQ34746.1 TetR family transcriptional regulator [Flavobacterium cyanobacteriorum]
MTTATRKLREKEELRQLILQSAKKLFVEKGIENTTIRNIADATDYSVGTVYVYFKDKNAILHDLHTIGFSELGGYFLEISPVDDPLERLKQMGRIYLKFAVENPDMYDLMFNIKEPLKHLAEKENDGCEAWDEGIGTFNILKSTVKDCIDKGYFSGHEEEPLSFMIWGVVHGMCTLEIRKRTKGLKFNRPETILTDGYKEFLKMLDKV